MKIRFRSWGFLLALSILSVSSVARAKGPTEADHFGERTTALFNAMMHKDSAALDAMLASDFLFTSFTGATADRAAYLQAATQFMTVTSFKLEPIAVHVYGNAATVFYHVVIAATVAGKAWPSPIVSTDTWVKQGDVWKLAARHSSAILGK